MCIPKVRIGRPMAGGYKADKRHGHGRESSDGAAMLDAKTCMSECEFDHTKARRRGQGLPRIAFEVDSDLTLWSIRATRSRPTRVDERSVHP